MEFLVHTWQQFLSHGPHSVVWKKWEQLQRSDAFYNRLFIWNHVFPTCSFGYSWRSIPPHSCSQATWICGFSLQGFKQGRKQHGRCLPQEAALAGHGNHWKSQHQKGRICPCHLYFSIGYAMFCILIHIAVSMIWHNVIRYNKFTIITITYYYYIILHIIESDSFHIVLHSYMNNSSNSMRFLSSRCISMDI